MWALTHESYGDFSFKTQLAQKLKREENPSGPVAPRTHDIHTSSLPPDSAILCVELQPNYSHLEDVGLVVDSDLFPVLLSFLFFASRENLLVKSVIPLSVHWNPIQRSIMFWFWIVYNSVVGAAERFRVEALWLLPPLGNSTSMNHLHGDPEVLIVSKSWSRLARELMGQFLVFGFFL